MKEQKLLLKGIFSIVQALIGCSCACLIAEKNPLLWGVAAILTGYINFCFWRQTDRRRMVCFGLLGAAFVLATALGMRLDASQQTGWDGLALCLGACLGIGTATGQVASWIYHGIERMKRPTRLSPGKAFWITFVLLVLCWLPVMLAYFPGVTGYDMDGQMWQITSGEYNAHHPLLHTLFVQSCVLLGQRLFGSISIGYGIHTALQLLLLAASIAYAMCWLCRIGCQRAVWWALLAFFALSPQNALLSVAGTKDVLFAAALLAVCVELIRFLLEKNRSSKWYVWLQDSLLITVMGLLRNNAIYALIVVFMLCVVCFRKQLGRNLLAIMLAGIALTFAGDSLLMKATGAVEGSIREMMCIPCQQLGRVHHLYGLNEPVGYECREVMPYVQDYSPERADFTKRAAEVDTPDRLIRFIKLWLRESVNFPIEYLDAFLFTSKGYWDITDLSYSTIYDRIDPNEPRGAIVMLHYDHLGIDEMGCWPQVKQWCRELVTLNGYQKNPLLSLLLHPAFYSWLLLFVMACACFRRNRAALVAGGLALAYLLTLLLGPCVLIRYQYYMMLTAPVLLGFLCSVGKDEQNV